MRTSKMSRALATMIVGAGAGVMMLGEVACDRNAMKDGSATNASGSTAAGSATITGAKVDQDPLANVENKGQVKEYADQTSISPPKAATLITGFTVEMRESPRGDVVASSETTETVREIAKNDDGNYYLIVFPDPKDTSKQLAGWVYKDAIENNGWASDNAGAAASSAKAKSGNSLKAGEKLSCARGESHVRTDSDFCAKTCKDDRGCDKKGGEICDGLGFSVHEKDGKLTNTNYCIAATSPGANNAHADQHGSSAPLDEMNKNYDPRNPTGSEANGNPSGIAPRAPNPNTTKMPNGANP